MIVWQADFYRRPLQDEAGNPLWELVLCDEARSFAAYVVCPQPEANSNWIADQFKQLGEKRPLPDRIQVFRPQSVSLIESAAQPLGIKVEPTRRTVALKELLQERAIAYSQLPGYIKQPYEPVKLDQPPPVPLPENLWGEQWRFGAIASVDIEPFISSKPIPVRSTPDAILPVNLKLPSTLLIPGVVIDGGRQSMRLARWLQQQDPIALNYIPGQPDGLILEAGLIDRWVVATFEDADVIAAARTFRERQQTSKGLHFLLIQPDDSGMTYSGFWLLQTGEGV